MYSCDEQRTVLSYAELGAAPVERPSDAALRGNAEYTCVLDLDDDYTRRHFLTALQRRPWWRVTVGPMDPHTPPQLFLGEYERVPWALVLSPPHVATNNLLVRKGLARKAQFASTMARHVTRCVDCPLTAALPQTVVIDTAPAFVSRPARIDLASALVSALADADDAMSSAALQVAAGHESTTGAPLWILKPSMANGGAELFIVTNIDEVESAVRRWRDAGQWVLQRYVERPLLLQSRKFHVRAYVLATGGLTVHVFREALLLLAAEPYADAPPSLRHAHIMNSCVGVGSSSFDAATHVRALSELPAMLLDERLARNASAAQQRASKLWTDICACVAHTFMALEGEVGGYMPLGPHAFELYGADLLVDADWHVWLLEFNPTPDVRQTGARLDGVIGSAIEGAVALAVDSHFPPPHLAPAVGTGFAAVTADHAQAVSRTSSATRSENDGGVPGMSEALVWQQVYSKEWPGVAAGVNVRVT